MPQTPRTRSRSRARPQRIADYESTTTSSPPTSSPSSPYVYAPTPTPRSRSYSRARPSPRHPRREGISDAAFFWRAFLLGFFLGLFAAVSFRGSNNSTTSDCIAALPDPLSSPLSSLLPPPPCPACPAPGRGGSSDAAPVTPAHVAWISYVPSLCWHDAVVKDALPAPLNATRGGVLGLFGAAHLGPASASASAAAGVETSDQQAAAAGIAGKARLRERLRACQAQVARGAGEQRGLFAEGSEGDGDALAGVLTEAQRGVVRGVVSAAEDSAAIACMTEGEKGEEAERVRRERRERERRLRHEKAMAYMQSTWTLRDLLAWPGKVLGLSD
ncbi:hypothetical protein SLS58_002845 [Diplodia intermedia]|uniref:Uncharacterized protein n=1 Tax=Diplodia intermedia TaxID=856260 RepID=A0ABR3TXS8_9PEZI